MLIIRRFIGLLRYLRRFFRWGLISLVHFILMILVFIVTLITRYSVKINVKQPRLVWGSTPLANNIYWSMSMKEFGFNSETFTDYYYSSATNREDWDLLMIEKYKLVPIKYRPYFCFIESLFNYDVFFISVDGYFFGQTPYWKMESFFLKLSKKKIVVIPYGGDAFVYHRIHSTSLLHGLLINYPLASTLQSVKTQRLDYWVQNADFVMPGIMGPDGFGRWDLLSPSSLAIDLKKWRRSLRMSNANGVDDTVYIAHAPNHRGFKGTEFIIEVVEQLKKEGFKIELILIENMKNEVVRRSFESEVDILVEQIIAPSYGLNGLEGMASGLCVISNFEDESYILPQRRWSFLSECPAVSGTPENLKDVLTSLIQRPELRRQLGEASRVYAEKYHSLESCQFLFSQVIEFIFERRGPLINFYHPINGEFGINKPKVKHPLQNNKIVN